MKTSDTATLKKVITDVLYNSKFISFFFCYNSMHTRN